MTVHWYAASDRFNAMPLNNEDSDNRCMWITNGKYVNWETTTEIQKEPNPGPLTYSSINVMGMKPSATQSVWPILQPKKTLVTHL
jgi:hypothetical protein